MRSLPLAVLPHDTPDACLKDTSDVSKLMAESINLLRRGKLDPRVANGIGYLASILMRSFEQGAMEQRVGRMEAVLGLTRKQANTGPDPQPTERPEPQPRDEDGSNT